MKCRVIRYEPDTRKEIPGIELFFETEAEADELVLPLQAQGERGWRIQWWTPYLIYYSEGKRGERGHFHETLVSALDEGKRINRDFRIVAWDNKTKAYKQAVTTGKYS